MKQHKNILYLATVIALLFTLAGCGSANEGNTFPPAVVPEKLPTPEITQPQPTEPVIHVHEWVTAVIAPNCTENGYTSYTCTACEEQYISDETKASGHLYKEALAKEATCAEAGIKTFTCENCGDRFTEEIPVPDHNYDSVIAEPTCETNGFSVYTCSVCADTYTDDIVAATGHDYASFVSNPTCKNSGYTSHICTICGHSYQGSDTKALGHDYAGIVISEATCATTGVKTFTCKLCGDTYREVLPAVGHSYASEVISPTCTESGYTVHTCLNCGDAYTDNETSATSHSYAETTSQVATCTSDGFRTFSCICGDSYTQVVAAAGHDYCSVITNPSCNTPGFTTHTCANCGNRYTDNETDATGHNYTATVTAPTCTEGGYCTYCCSVCGNTFVDNHIPATGHGWSDWDVITAATEEAEGLKIRACQSCGAQESAAIEKLTHTHNYVVSHETTPTCSDAGILTKTCACGDVITEIGADALGHDWIAHHQDETGHYESYIFCHCGNWSCLTSSGRYDLAFMDHVDADHDGCWWDWSYYGRNIWTVDVPAKDWLECSVCGSIQ